MDNLIRINKRLIPLEHVALVEPYVADPNSPLRTSKDFKSRIVLLDKDSVLSEDSTEEFAARHAFRMIAPDGIATNPEVAYWVETFAPDDSFRPEKPFATRILWRAVTGFAHSRLLLAPPEAVLAIAVRGLREPPNTEGDAEPQPARRKRPATPRKRELAKDPA